MSLYGGLVVVLKDPVPISVKLGEGLIIYSHQRVDLAVAVSTARN